MRKSYVVFFVAVTFVLGVILVYQRDKINTISSGFDEPEEYATGRRLSFVNNVKASGEYAAREFNFQSNLDSILGASELRKQRNEFSKLLNLHKQVIGQLQCEKVAGNAEETSKSGGWCPTATKEKHHTDLSLVKALSQFFKGKSVGSFGDGPGMYKKLLLADGKVQAFDSYDGAPFCEETSDGRVHFLDLTLPQYGLPLYDWILSLEVAEHIPAQFEKIFIDNIVRHAKEGVVLSWATPGQEGYSHVNMKTFEYVKNLMESLGFAHDSQQSSGIRSSARGPNLKRNINVFLRKDVSENNVQKLRLDA